MKSRLVPSALVLLGAATPGLAVERLAVHAEDTPGMTRVEIKVGEAPFSLEKPEPGVIDFVTPYRFQSVDLAALIAGGAARRVANARLVPDEAATRLRMVLNCECGFDFSVSSGALSVRIRDEVGGEAHLAPAEQVEKQAEVVSATPRKPAPDIAPPPLARPGRDSTEGLIVAAPAPEMTITEAFGADDDRVTATQLSSFAEPAEEEPVEEVVLARDHLMRQLSRAAEQGLIQFVSEEAAAQSPAPAEMLEKVSITELEEQAPALDEGAHDAEVNETPKAAVAATPPAPPPGPVEMPLRARTAVDKVFSPDRNETLVDVAYCVDPERLNLIDWSQSGSFLDVTQELRSQLLDEFDQPKPEVATKLARHFVLNGFGAEAAEMIRVYGDAIEDHEVLGDLARLVDLKAPDPKGDIARTAPCHADAVLWRAIAGLPDGEPTTDPAESEDIARQALEAFARLPAATRRVLSSRLMNNLIAKGALDLANQLDLILSRSPSAEDEALTLARARLLSETGKLEEAETLYTRLSQSNRPDAHRALILLLDSRIRRNADGSEQLSDALGDAAFSARGTSLELPLKVAEVRSRTLTDGATAALETLQNAMVRAGGATGLLQDVGHAALEQLEPVEGDVVDYAKAVMAIRPQVSEGPSGDPARRKVADVLIGSGLPNLALSYIEPALERPSPSTALVAARIWLALDKPEEALEALDGQVGPDFTQLKVDALERLGRYDDAHRLSKGAGADEGVDRSARALRAGDWADAAEAGETPQRLLAAYMASQKSLKDADDAQDADAFLASPEVDPDATLEAVRSVIDASKSARSVIERALEDG